MYSGRTRAPRPSNVYSTRTPIPAAGILGVTEYILEYDKKKQVWNAGTPEYITPCYTKMPPGI